MHVPAPILTLTRFLSRLTTGLIIALGALLIALALLSSYRGWERGGGTDTPPAAGDHAPGTRPGKPYPLTP